MMWSAISTSIELNILVLILFVVARISRRSSVSAAMLLRLNYVAVASVFVILVAIPILPRAELFTPPVHVWAGEFENSASQNANSESNGVFTFGENKSSSVVMSEMALTSAWLVSLSVIAFLVFGFMALEMRRWHWIRQSSFSIRSIGRVDLRASDKVVVPFSLWFWGRATVLIPTSLLAQSTQDQRAVLLHEFQHHRQNDTKWIYLIRFLQLICFWNPFVHLWARDLSEIQEFACDETVVDRNLVKLQDYTSCLLRVAETALIRNKGFACATGLSFQNEGSTLRRRIVKMYAKRKSRSRIWSSVVGVVVVITMAGVGWASQDVVRDRHVTMAEAKAMAQTAGLNTPSEFPIQVNEEVLRELNQFVGTRRGREFMRDSLARMEEHRSLIEPKLREYGIPIELMAIPIIESGYRNLPDLGKRPHGAGLWMFIASTALAYGLQVDAVSGLDERLNIEKETDAAMRLLLSEKIRFSSWTLSVLAYNAGDKIVTKGTMKLKTRDVWELIRAGYDGDKNYVAKLMAAILIMRNPQVLSD